MPRTSAGETVATPDLATSTPAAKFATCAASRTDAPAASAVPTHAVTVSPAPETSNTSRAIAGMRCTCLSLVNSAIPSAPSVSSRLSTPSLSSDMGSAAGCSRSSVAHGALQPGGELLLGTRRDRVLHFFVDPHHLLATRSDARFGGGESRGRDHDVLVHQPVLHQLRAKRVAPRVVADHGHQPALG